ncbi:MAG TPA: SAM-dependent methyltransferase [Actinomycetales bacterium]
MPTLRSAWHESLYGPAGFYRSSAPVAHFRTSVHAGPAFAAALARLARESGLGRVVDVGSGRGELLRTLADVDPGLALVGVDVVPRPEGLPAGATWVRSPGGEALPDLGGAGRGALVVANEWLDDVPCPVLEVDERGALREVCADGSLCPGDPAADDVDWARRWWPTGDAEPGDRVEVGLTRDRAWAHLAAQCDGSVLLAADYAHHRAARPVGGTLRAYRGGMPAEPVPDGDRDLTAHVALDAVAAAVPARWSLLTTQRRALRALGVSGATPPHALSRTDSAAYLRALVAAGEAGELLDTRGLGAFGWLVQSLGPEPPAALAGLGR